MALSNINPQTFTVPEKQVLLYKQGDATYYKRYTGTTGTLDDKTLKALGIAKQQLPCLIYDADLLRGLNASLANVDSVTVATSYKASLQYVKQASFKKLDKHVYLNDQVKLLDSINKNTSDIIGLKEAINNIPQQGNSTPTIIVTQLVNGKIVIPNNRIPIAIKTNKGTLFNIDFEFVAQAQQNYLIDPAAYLAYDNSSSFQGSWIVYLGSCYVYNAGGNVTQEVTVIINQLITQVNQANATIKQMQTTMLQMQTNMSQMQTKLDSIQNSCTSLTECV